MEELFIQKRLSLCIRNWGADKLVRGSNKKSNPAVPSFFFPAAVQAGIIHLKCCSTQKLHVTGI